MNEKGKIFDFNIQDDFVGQTMTPVLELEISESENPVVEI